MNRYVKAGLIGGGVGVILSFIALCILLAWVERDANHL